MEELQTGDLFAWASRVRASDPSTARQAAMGIAGDLTALEQQFLTALEKLDIATANEIAAWIAGENFGRRNTLRRRASDLVAKGWIERSGARACSVTGKKATTYKVVSHG